MPAANKIRSWIQLNNVDDYQNGHSNFDDLDDLNIFDVDENGNDIKTLRNKTDVVKVKTEKGDTIYLREFELNDILERVLDKAITEKGFNMYQTAEKKLLENIDEKVANLQKTTSNYFMDKIDKVAEEIANAMISAEIEKRIKLKFEQKMAQMKKIFEDGDK